ncbi:hypothetical protein [Tessaracoccus caeni]|uniref:hypothetical protein n=1 Tax=Tessaracoccus caeni TaxID=3031239 RepID=UPI0023DBC349|nr:hypothetical protein [Tessaracoccus caeni]MDF1489262.1 hypothetical protein [Tessaracoccus caeni]
MDPRPGVEAGILERRHPSQRHAPHRRTDIGTCAQAPGHTRTQAAVHADRQAHGTCEA